MSQTVRPAGRPGTGNASLDLDRLLPETPELLSNSQTSIAAQEFWKKKQHLWWVPESPTVLINKIQRERVSDYVKDISSFSFVLSFTSPTIVFMFVFNTFNFCIFLSFQFVSRDFYGLDDINDIVHEWLVEAVSGKNSSKRKHIGKKMCSSSLGFWQVFSYSGYCNFKQTSDISKAIWARWQRYLFYRVSAQIGEIGNDYVIATGDWNCPLNR